MSAWQTDGQTDLLSWDDQNKQIVGDEVVFELIPIGSDRLAQMIAERFNQRCWRQKENKPGLQRVRVREPSAVGGDWQMCYEGWRVRQSDVVTTMSVSLTTSSWESVSSQIGALLAPAPISATTQSLNIVAGTGFHSPHFPSAFNFDYFFGNNSSIGLIVGFLRSPCKCPGWKLVCNKRASWGWALPISDVFRDGEWCCACTRCCHSDRIADLECCSTWLNPRASPTCH